MEDFLLYEKSGGIVTLTMNRPETRNALSTSEICSEFVDRLRAIECDPSVNVVILTGAGPAFCAGGDIKKMRDRSGFAPMKTIIDTRDSYRRTIHQVAKALNAVEVPMIAAVNGPSDRGRFGLGLHVRHADCSQVCEVCGILHQGGHNPRRWRRVVPPASHRNFQSERTRIHRRYD